MNNIIQTTALTKRYGHTAALDGLTVLVAEHSITGLVGRNGSGKTTLLKILAGLLNHTGGEVEVFGEAPMDNLKTLEQLVYSYHNLPHDKMLRLEHVLRAYREMMPAFDMGFAEKLLAYFELPPKLKYGALSQGMASVFNFICTLACRAPLTMLDEPVLGMDVTVRQSVYEILLRDYAEHPRTFIISSHLLSEIEGLLSHILLIEQGKAVLQGAIDDIRQSAYRADGDAAALDRFADGKTIIARRTGTLNCYTVLRETLDEKAETEAKALGLTLSPVRAEDLCVYLTQRRKEEDLECLW